MIDFRRPFVILSLLLIFWAVSSSVGRAQSDVRWYDLFQAQQLAKENHKKVFIYAKASWCRYCKKMEAEVYSQPSIQDSLAKYYYPVKIDIESPAHIVFNGEQLTAREFSRLHRISATPTMFFVAADGRVLGRQPGFISSKIFGKLLSYVGNEVYRSVGFKEYLKN